MSASDPFSPPRVLCISGHDPGGGAGIQADIEAVAALGGHAQCVITALTVQDSANVLRTQAVDAALLDEQLRCLLDDSAPQALKIGLLGAAAQLPMIASVIQRVRVPVVLDPVLRAGGGQDFGAGRFTQQMQDILFPLITVLTPNAAEARRLVPGAVTLDDCGLALLKRGCENILITGGDEPEPIVVNRWYQPGTAPRRFEWPRLPQTFHGAGCTLAAAIATNLAQGLATAEAVQQAQAWTHECLRSAIRTGRGRLVPSRVRVR